MEELDSKNVLIKKSIYSAISTEYNNKIPNQISCGVGLAEIKGFTVEIKDGKTTGKTSLAELTVASGKTIQRLIASVKK